MLIPDCKCFLIRSFNGCFLFAEPIATLYGIINHDDRLLQLRKNQ